MDNTEQMSEWIEWEIENKGYLQDKKLVKMEYPKNAAHAHCELCWARFGYYPGDLMQGYFECESHSWICEDCYHLFKQYFRWSIQSNSIMHNAIKGNQGDGSMIDNGTTGAASLR